MLHEQKGTLPIGAERRERGEDLARAARIEVRGRLVEDQSARGHREEGRERDALLGSAREPLEQARRIGSEPGGRARRGHATVHLFPRDAEVLEAERDLVVGLEHYELRLGILEEHAHGPRELREARRARVATLDRDAPGLPVRFERMRDHAVEAERERALTRAARAEQQEALALAPLEVELAQRRSLASDVADGERLGARERA